MADTENSDEQWEKRGKSRFSLASLFTLTTLVGAVIAVAKSQVELLVVLAALFLPALLRTMGWRESLIKAGRTVTFTELILSHLGGTLAVAWMLVAVAAPYGIAFAFVRELTSERFSPLAYWAGMIACIACGLVLLREAWWLPWSEQRPPTYYECALIHLNAVALCLFVISSAYVFVPKLLLLRDRVNFYYGVRNVTWVSLAITTLLIALTAGGYFFARRTFHRGWVQVLSAIVMAWCVSREFEMLDARIVAAPLIGFLIALPGVLPGRTHD